MNCPRCGAVVGPYDPYCPRCGQPFAPSRPQGSVQGGPPSREAGAPYGQPGSPSGPASQRSGAGWGQGPGWPAPTSGQASGWSESAPSSGWGYAPSDPGMPLGPYSRQMPPPDPPSGRPDAYGWDDRAPQPQRWDAAPAWGEPPARATRTRGLGATRVIVSVLVTVVIIALAGIGGVYLTHIKNPNSSILPPFASGGGGPSVVFSDALTTPDTQWPNGAHCRFGTGGYLVTDNYFCLPNTEHFRDVSVKVSAKLVSGPSDAAFGLVLRSPDQQNYYVFHIFADGRWDFARPASTTFDHIIGPTASSAIKTGPNATNTLEADLSGTHFTFLVNGVKVGEATDATYASGQMGFDSEDGVTVMYNNFVITQP